MAMVHSSLSSSPRRWLRSASFPTLCSRFFFPASSSSVRYHYRASPFTFKLIPARCSGSVEGGSDASSKGILSEMLDKGVEELLRSEGNRGLVEELQRAEKRVQDARNELAEIERQEREAANLKEYVRKLEIRASEIEECQREISLARTMIEEAESTLSSNIDRTDPMNDSFSTETGDVDKEAERWESVKASSVSAVVGTLAGLPITLAQANSDVEVLLHAAVTFISCALFGVTFRYTMRRDLDNIQLKTGTSAAFGFVKGLAELEGMFPMQFNEYTLVNCARDAAIYVSENIFIFLFAAIGLDYCFKVRLLSPFPMRSSSSRTTSR
ncbi:uncharacterized protein LOC116248286 [Nymphaea colorata]|nr:uncharacterized protein LOC116248286 [Nymphaea colorata]